MNYENIFDDITRSIRKDYAGAAEIKKPAEASDFAANLSNAFKAKKLDDIYFLRVMNQYLATIGDYNMALKLADNDHYKNTTCGFTVRCYEKELYVTSSEDERVKVGDKIEKVNYKSPKWYLEHMTKNIFWSDTEERMNFTEFFNSSEKIRVLHADGTKESMELNKFPVKEKETEITVTPMEDGKVVLKISSFYDTERLEAVVEENKELLASAKTLIIDLRDNEGGYDNAFYCLIPYLIDRPMKRSEFMGEQGQYTNYTKKNARRREIQMRPYRDSEDEEVKALAETLIAEAKELAGKGYIYEKDEDITEHDEFLAPAGNGPVIFLTDVTTKDAAEMLISQAARMKKVSVIGRPTCGTIDYSNVVAANYEGGFCFTYPISRSRDCQKGKCVKGVGLPVDTYIAWTPAELSEDIILKAALAR